MAKRTLTMEQLRDRLEQKMIDRLVAIDDEIAEEFEIGCWDMCLDGADWNKTLKTLVEMYVKAIVSDREDSLREYKVKVDITSELERQELAREIKRLERKLKEQA